MELNFKLSIEQANTVMEALGNAPYRTVAPIVALMQQQAQAQMAKEAAVDEARERHRNPPNVAEAANHAASNGAIGSAAG